MSVPKTGQAKGKGKGYKTTDLLSRKKIKVREKKPKIDEGVQRNNNQMQCRNGS